MEPVKTVEEIKISDDSEKCPPYTKFTYHYKVLEELLNPGGSMVNKEINVFPFNWKTDFEDHKEYYLEGLGKSVIREVYENTLTCDPDEFIIFLSSQPPNFDLEFTFDGAIESISLKDEIIKLIKDLRNVSQKKRNDRKRGRLSNLLVRIRKHGRKQ
jgi:hypothetical protein